MSATATTPNQGMFGVLDQIDSVAATAFAGLKQYTQGTRQLMQMLGGLTNGNIPQTAVTPVIVAPSPAATVNDDASAPAGVPDATAIVSRGKKKKVTAAKKPAAKKGGRRRATTQAAPAADGATDAAAEAEVNEVSPDQPSLRSVVWSVLTRPENAEKGLRAGGDGASVLKTIIDENLWVSKKNGNMPALISQCLHTLKKGGKVTRDSETHCFIAKPGISLD